MKTYSSIEELRQARNIPRALHLRGLRQGDAVLVFAAHQMEDGDVEKPLFGFKGAKSKIELALYGEIDVGIRIRNLEYLDLEFYVSLHDTTDTWVEIPSRIVDMAMPSY